MDKTLFLCSPSKRPIVKSINIQRDAWGCKAVGKKNTVKSMQCPKLHAILPENEAFVNVFSPWGFSIP